MTTQTVATSLMGDLILARLLTAAKPPSPKQLRKDVNAFFRQGPGEERWQAQLDELAGAGLLTIRPLRLTDAGRAQALAFLELEAPPPQADWRAVKARYLVPRALGLPLGGEALDERHLAPLLLKKHYGLTLSGSVTMSRVLEALACKTICERLGLDVQQDFRGVLTAILGGELDKERRYTREEIEKHLPPRIAGAAKGGVQALRDAILLRWADGQQDGESAPAAAPVPEPEPEPAEFDLPAFARTVLRVADDCPTGRFGDNKVFISHVWQRLRQEPTLPPFDLATFKARLVEASQAGLLRLSRADLVQMMDPHDVQESQTTSGDAVFHFILIERDRP